MTREQALKAISEALPKVYGLCHHAQEGPLPAPAKECSRCVAEEVMYALEQSVGLRWES